MKKLVLPLILAAILLAGCGLGTLYEDIQGMITAITPTTEAVSTTMEATTEQQFPEEIEVPAEETVCPTEETMPSETVVKEPAVKETTAKPNVSQNNLCKLCGYGEAQRGYDGLCEECFVDQLPPQVCERCNKSFKIIYIPTNGICPECERLPREFTCMVCLKDCASFNVINVCDVCEETFCYGCMQPMGEEHICEFQ